MHVFLSPHLDDAILSCGGRIYQLTQRGEQVVIVNVMAGDPPQPLPDSPLIRELHARWAIGEYPVAIRRQEDEAAAALLGASCIHLSIPDCIYRTVDNHVLYSEGDADLFGAVHPHDPAINHLKTMKLPDARQITHLYAPLGVGNHVDHQLVRQWAFDQSADYPAVQRFLYADYPYSSDLTAIEHARATLSHLPLQQQDIVLNPAELAQKLAAIACYDSQISTFWQNLDAMQAQISQDMYNLGNGQPVECIWHLTSPFEE